MEPRLDIVLRTSGVRAVGEKMARAPDWRRTVFFFFGWLLFVVVLCSDVGTSQRKGKRGSKEERTDCAATADFEFAKASKWGGAGCYVGCDLADYHHF